MTELSDIYERLGVIETNVATLLERSNAGQRREENCRVELTRRLDHHEKLLRGNGTLGLVAQVAELERQAIERAAERARMAKLMYSVLGVVLVQLLFRVPDVIALLQAHRITP